MPRAPRPPVAQGNEGPSVLGPRPVCRAQGCPRPFPLTSGAMRVVRAWFPARHSFRHRAPGCLRQEKTCPAAGLGQGAAVKQGHGQSVHRGLLPAAGRAHKLGADPDPPRGHPGGSALSCPPAPAWRIAPPAHGGAWLHHHPWTWHPPHWHTGVGGQLRAPLLCPPESSDLPPPPNMPSEMLVGSLHRSRDDRTFSCIPLPAYARSSQAAHGGFCPFCGGDSPGGHDSSVLRTELRVYGQVVCRWSQGPGTE